MEGEGFGAAGEPFEEGLGPGFGGEAEGLGVAAECAIVGLEGAFADPGGEGLERGIVEECDGVVGVGFFLVAGGDPLGADPLEFGGSGFGGGLEVDEGGGDMFEAQGGFEGGGDAVDAGFEGGREGDAEVGDGGNAFAGLEGGGGDFEGEGCFFLGEGPVGEGVNSARGDIVEGAAGEDRQGGGGGAAGGIDEVEAVEVAVGGGRIEAPGEWGFREGDGLAVLVDDMAAEDVRGFDELGEGGHQGIGEDGDVEGVDGAVGVLEDAENAGAAGVEEGGVAVVVAEVGIDLAEEFEFGGCETGGGIGAGEDLGAFGVEAELKFDESRGGAGGSPGKEPVVPALNLAEVGDFFGEILDEVGVDGFGKGIGEGSVLGLCGDLEEGEEVPGVAGREFGRVDLEGLVGVGVSRADGLEEVGFVDLAAAVVPPGVGGFEEIGGFAGEGAGEFFGDEVGKGGGSGRWGFFGGGSGNGVGIEKKVPGEGGGVFAVAAVVARAKDDGGAGEEGEFEGLVVEAVGFQDFGVDGAVREEGGVYDMFRGFEVEAAGHLVSGAVVEELLEGAGLFGGEGGGRGDRGRCGCDHGMGGSGAGEGAVIIETQAGRLCPLLFWAVAGEVRGRNRL